jgi:hypothetical protein
MRAIEALPNSMQNKTTEMENGHAFPSAWAAILQSCGPSFLNRPIILLVDGLSSAQFAKILLVPSTKHSPGLGAAGSRVFVPKHSGAERGETSMSLNQLSTIACCLFRKICSGWRNVTVNAFAPSHSMAASIAVCL